MDVVLSYGIIRVDEPAPVEISLEEESPEPSEFEIHIEQIDNDVMCRDMSVQGTSIHQQLLKIITFHTDSMISLNSC